MAKRNLATLFIAAGLALTASNAWAEASAVKQLRETNACPGCNLDGESFAEEALQGADLQGASLVGTILQKTYMPGAKLQGANLSKADLRGADLTAAEVDGATVFEGAQFCGTVMPDMSIRDDHCPAQ